MPRKKETLTLSVPPGTKAQLEAIADRLDIRSDPTASLRWNLAYLRSSPSTPAEC